MRIIISLILSIAMFIVVNAIFGHIADKNHIPLYIEFDEPIQIGGGPSSYEQYGTVTATGCIAMYFACLAAYLTFNITRHGVVWVNNLIKLNIIFSTLGILIQFVPLIIVSLIFAEMKSVPGLIQNVISLGLEISLLYLNWKYTYHLYSRKKSRLNGYKLWAVMPYKSKSYYMIIEALTKEDAFELAKSSTSHLNIDLKADNLEECEVKCNLLLKSEAHVESYVNARHVMFKG